MRKIFNALKQNTIKQLDSSDSVDEFVMMLRAQYEWWSVNKEYMRGGQKNESKNKQH
jgi:hypothetical protein